MKTRNINMEEIIKVTINNQAEEFTREELANYFLYTRLSTELTMFELGELVNRPVGTIANYEKGNYIPKNLDEYLIKYRKTIKESMINKRKAS